MSSSALTVFSYGQDEVRTMLVENQPWFASLDVCKILDIADHKTAMNRLDDDEKGVHTMHTPGGNQSMLCVNEPGLYHLIFTSRKEEARAFRKWVTGEVLPSIRKTGAYAVVPAQEPALNMRAMERMIASLRREIRQVQPGGVHITRRELEAHILDAVREWQEDYPEGICIRELREGDPWFAVYGQRYTNETLFLHAEKLVERGLLHREERGRCGVYYYTAPL